MRVLLIAEQANPEWVSVPLVGWSLCKAIGDLADAHIVTQVRNREAFKRAGLEEGRDFTSIDNESIARPLHQLGGLMRGGAGRGWTVITALQSLSYYSFERQVWELFKDRIQAGEFSLVHRVTPLSPTSPSTLASKCRSVGVPFLMGPLNGGLSWPPGFASRRHAEREWLSYFRSFYKILPGYHSSRRDASVIFVGSMATRDQISIQHREKTFYLPENGIDIERFSAIRLRKAAIPLRGVFIGRLVEYKCPDLLLRAAAPFMRAKQMCLQIAGDGPMLPDLKKIAKEENISDATEFLGWVAHSRIQDVLAESDFLVLPSIREFGGGVVLEAMAMGVPPIVADYGGPGELVSEGTGLKVLFNDEQSLLNNLKSTFARVIETPALLEKLSIEAKAEVQRSHTWHARARQIVSVYERFG